MQPYELFWQRYQEAPTLAPRLTMRFASPAVFQSQDTYLPLPIPRLVFEGLARRWSTYSPYPPPHDFLSFVEGNVLVQSYRLRTRLTRFGKHQEGQRIPGFVGVCTFAVRVPQQYWLFGSIF